MKLRYKIGGGILGFLVVVIAVLAITLSYTSDCGPAPVVSDDAELMQAIEYRCYGSPDVLELTNIEKPTPADDEVLVKIQAASVNPLDWHYMRGSPYFMRLGTGIGAPSRTSMGVDFSGTVEAVGKNVKLFKPGDEVFGGGAGAFAEYLTIREDRGLAMKPANMTFAEVAAVPIAGVSALQALRDYAEIQPGQKVLINGASGGVGTFAVQIAKSLGAEVTGVCSTRNLEMVRSIGADFVVDYTQEDYTEGDKHYDVIIDMVGNHSPLENRRALAPTGKLVMVGGPSGDWLGPAASLLKAKLLSPFVEQEFVMILARLRKDDLVILAELMQAGEVTPVIDRHYVLSEIADAIRYSEEGHVRGKIVIDMK